MWLVSRNPLNSCNRVLLPCCVVLGLIVLQAVQLYYSHQHAQKRTLISNELVQVTIVQRHFFNPSVCPVKVTASRCIQMVTLPISIFKMGNNLVFQRTEILHFKNRA